MGIRNLSIIYVAALLLFLTSALVAWGRNIDYVNTFIGTGGQGFGIGSIPPGAQVPFGLMRAGPDTVWYDNIFLYFNHFGGYYYDDSHIRAFSHTHLVGAGICDYGQLGVMAVSSYPTPSLVDNYGYRSTFSHKNESAHPGYYSVYLETHGVQAELTATQLTAVHRYRWDRPDAVKTILFDIGHAIQPASITKATARIDALRREISGSVLLNGPLSKRFGGFTIYYVVKFPYTWSRFGTWLSNDGGSTIFTGSSSVEGKSAGAFVTFDGNLAGNTLEFHVGISSISVEQAGINLNVQSQGLNFNQVRQMAENDWETSLSVIEVDNTAGPVDHDSVVQLYSALYRTLLAPTRFDEPSGRPGENAKYVGFDKQVHTLPPSMNRYFSDMSIWDTFRSEMPWLALIDPKLTSEMATSLLLMYEQGGDLPRWPMAYGYTNCMIGTHAIVILVDSWYKGAQFNTSLAWKAILQSATQKQKEAGRTDVDFYLQKGYVSYEAVSKSASHTLEYAYDDWAVGNFARDVLGRNDEAAIFYNRSQNYRNTWDPSKKFFCARRANGQFECPWTMLNVFDSTFVEGDAWHWRWFVPHDVQGLAELFGSKEQFVTELDYFMAHAADFPFNILPNPYYWAGNEPDIFAPWMFSFVGRPDLTQKWTRYQLNYEYSSKPDGLPGNDDYGTMSAWQIFAMLGFYPLAGSPLYILGSPVFPYIKIHRALGDIEIIVHDASSTNIYISKFVLNGRVMDIYPDGAFLHHQSIHHGGKLEFWMTSTPPNFS